MRLFPAWLLMAAVVLVASAGHAQTGGQTPAKRQAKAQIPKIECATATAPPEMVHCAEIRLKKADSDLAAALAKARAQIAKAKGAAPYDAPAWTAVLDDAHKTWLTYREADCKGLVPYEWQGGTGSSLAVFECMAQMTETRAYELSERYADGRW